MFFSTSSSGRKSSWEKKSVQVRDVEVDLTICVRCSTLLLIEDNAKYVTHRPGLANKCLFGDGTTVSADEMDEVSSLSLSLSSIIGSSGGSLERRDLMNDFWRELIGCISLSLSCFTSWICIVFS